MRPVDEQRNHPQGREPRSQDRDRDEEERVVVLPHDRRAENRRRAPRARPTPRRAPAVPTTSASTAIARPVANARRSASVGADAERTRDRAHRVAVHAVDLGRDAEEIRVRRQPVEADHGPRDEEGEGGRGERGAGSAVAPGAEQPKEKWPDEELRRDRQPGSDAAAQPTLAPTPRERNERDEKERRVSGQEVAEHRRRDEGERVAPEVANTERPEREREAGAQNRDPEREPQRPRQAR